MKQLSRSDDEAMRALSSYHRGLAAFASWRRLGERNNLEGASKDFRQAIALLHPPVSRDKIQHFVLREESTPSRSMELLRPDGQEILRIASDGKLSLGNLDATTIRTPLSTLPGRSYAPIARERLRRSTVWEKSTSMITMLICSNSFLRICTRPKSGSWPFRQGHPSSPAARMIVPC